MTTALETITGALRLLGVASPGQSLSSDDATTGLAVLNEMLDDWSTHNLIVYTPQDQVFNLLSGVATYTLGPTGSWAGSRPTQINQARATYQSIDFDIEIVSNEQYNNIPFKAQQGIVPSVLAYAGTVPNGTVTVWPVPTSTLPITISGNQQFAQIATTATTLVLPPGYARALRFNLAKELQGEYGVQLSPIALQTAASALGNIKRANVTPDEAEFDPMFTQGPGGDMGRSIVGGHSGNFDGGTP